MKSLPIKPPSSQYTDTQWQSIHDGGDNLLVSASAGSGKTTVLVERVIEKIKAGISLDELLVVTYTNAAAKEMKERIQSAIQNAINKEPETEQRRHFVQQIPLLGQADISTIHAFCLKVIRRFYYLIDLDPVFRLLADDTEILLIKEEVWDEVREELYGEEDTLFKKLAATYSNDRNDDGLSDLIFSLHQFSRANTDPDGWLNSLTSLYHVGGSLEYSAIFIEFLQPQMRQILESCIELVESALQLGGGDSEVEKQSNLLETEKQSYQSILDAMMERRLTDAYNQIHSMVHDTWPSPRGKSDEVKEIVNEMKPFRDAAKDKFVKMKKEYFVLSPEEQLKLMESAKELVEEMARVTKRFADAYQAYKQERKLVDFNDLEHYTLAILADKSTSPWSPSEASQFYREQFNEVMVDEYQDINQLQEAILYWLTEQEEEGNLFMVGDVKQSIYAFRLADPGLFIKKYERYANGDGGERIILAENFRSRKEVLDFTNFVFSQIMNKEVGQLNYDQAAELVAGFPHFPDEKGFETDLLIYESKVADDSADENEELETNFEIDTKTQGELLMTAEKILEMKQDGFEIYDKKAKKNRPLAFSDIVLLTPTKKKNLEIQDIFNQMGIPTAVKETQNYFQTTEVSIMMSLLKVIDNPHQDIPLAAVLRSPIVGLDENDLAMIRIANKTSDFYEAMLTYWRGYSDSKQTIVRERRLFNKVDVFLNQLEKWRELARRMRLVDLIWMLYEDTGFLEYVSGMSSGKQRKANLHALYERAASYEKTNFKGLFQFIRFIEKMQKKDKDLAEPAALTDGEDAVRVMTIHASKGLEFPVVFVMDMTKRFNTRDASGDYILDETYGVGVQYKDLDTQLSFPTLQKMVLSRRKKNKLISEEMRKLYVALTRAEQKLILVGSYESEHKAWQRWGKVAAHEGTILPDDIRLNALNMMDWVGMSIIRHPASGQNMFPDTQNPTVKNHSVKFSVQFVKDQDIQEKAGKLLSQEGEEWYESFKEKETPLDLDKETIEAVRKAVEKMNVSYSHQAATHTTSYQSVSEIKRLFEDPDEEVLVKLDATTPRGQNRYVQDELERPSFISELTVPTPAEVGMASHSVLQTISLTEKPTEERLLSLIQEMVENETVSEEVAERIQTDKLLRFFETDLADRIVQQAPFVKREVPFSLMLEANKIFAGMEDGDGDKILIHGIVDGYIEEEDGLVLFDYKTDRVERFGDKAAEVMLDKYRGQLNLYRAALQNILAKPVKETYLVLLETTEIVPLR